jgi:hypothetical protein
MVDFTGMEYGDGKVMAKPELRLADCPDGD